jgi:pyruvate/2-oxoglutarate/acetoin dehydrogenase E1 component
MPEIAERAVERELTFAQAVREALAEEMRRDPTVCIIGEDVAEAGTPFKVLSGLVEEFGKERVIDTPISEAGFTGVGVGAAMTGMRPVVDIMFGDFLTLTMDQMVNQAAKVHYMSGGKWESSYGVANHAGRDATFSGATLAVIACMVQPRAGTEGGVAFDSVRCQRLVEDRHSRR